MEDIHAFVTGALPAQRPCRLLEVGCGRGELARRLAADGHEVTALDLEAPAPEDGLRFVRGDFMTWKAPPASFDVVLFTTSLHHISPLGVALDRARRLLAPGGALILDEFDLNAPDEETARWYYGVQGVELDAAVALARWHEEHRHEGERLHTGEEMLAAVGERFEILRSARGAYLHRHLRHDPREELMGLATKQLRAVGLRVVAV